MMDDLCLWHVPAFLGPANLCKRNILLEDLSFGVSRLSSGSGLNSPLVIAANPAQHFNDVSSDADR